VSSKVGPPESPKHVPHLCGRPGLFDIEPDLLHIGAMTLGGLDAGMLVATTYARYYGHDPPAHSSWQRRTRSIDAVMADWARGHLQK
jgi:hypothetical protein